MDGEAGARAPRASLWSGAWYVVRRDGRFRAGAAGLAVIVALAAVAPFLPHAPFDYWTNRPVGPSLEFPLGTDYGGRDELSMLASAASLSLFVGAVGSLAATAIGTVVGAVAACGGLLAVPLPGGRRLGVGLEPLLMRAADVTLAIPAILLAFALKGLMGGGVPLVLVVIAATCWTGPARIVYGRVRGIRGSTFVEAARAAGVGEARIVSRHVLPHVLPIVLVYMALGFATAVLLEATLTYLGAGVPIGEGASWGAMIYDTRLALESYPWLTLLPGLALIATIVSLVLIADALADALDPRSWTGETAAAARARVGVGGRGGGFAREVGR